MFILCRLWWQKLPFSIFIILYLYMYIYKYIFMFWGKSVYENVIDDVDEVREWLWRMQNATATKASSLNESISMDDETNDENFKVEE